MSNIYGYRRKDSRVGIRNHLLILPLVQCVNFIAQRISAQIPGSVTIFNAYGCSQVGSDTCQTQRTLSGFACNPNVGACLLIGLGCEDIDCEDMASSISTTGKIVDFIRADHYSSVEEVIDQGLILCRKMQKDLSKEEKELFSVENLILGLECGGSDSWSGFSANPATGICSDILISCGGTAVLSETQEMIGAEKIFAKKAINKTVQDAFLEKVNTREKESIEGGVDIASVNPSPGNKVGGLTTIEEKSLGCMQKGGTRARLVEVIDYAFCPSKKGLVFMDTPGDDVESITGMVAGGCQIIIFTTGRGTSVGNPIVPVIKVASNTEVYESMKCNIDFNAGEIVDGTSDIESIGKDLYAKLISVCNGEMTKSEILTCCSNFSITRTGITL